MPAFKVDHIIDTTGAGDGFAAGVLSGLIRGWDLLSFGRVRE